jgi:hypothetical protein
MWNTYPNEVKKLIEDPISAFNDALKRANELSDWKDIETLVDVFNCITATYSSE